MSEEAELHSGGFIRYVNGTAISRIRVPGGWIYILKDESPSGVHAAFSIADPQEAGI